MRSHLLPCSDGFTNEAVYGLGECRSGLVYGNIKEADSIAWKKFSGTVRILGDVPKDAADAQGRTSLAQMDYSTG